ncbi:MAG: SHOCT domain-containing protein [Actinomycetia bacterium]|nr:SHOCT domain-containing protein [Actinomycetes bacterium]
MMWGYGGIGILWMLLFWVGVVVLIVWGVRQVGGNSTSNDAGNRALQILDERFARGEIDADEFQQRRSELERR